MGGEQQWGGQFGPRFGRAVGPMLWQFAQRFPFGSGGGPGFGRGGPFGRGDLKYALLKLLQERPKHGYEMIKELESQSGGFYTPSTGAVYPTLQELEDRGWVTGQAVEGKKVYTLTDAGHAALTEYQQRGESFGRAAWWQQHGAHGPFGGRASPELQALRQEAVAVAQLVRDAVLATVSDPKRLSQLHTIVKRVHADLDAFLGQGRSRGGDKGTPTDYI